MEATSTARYKQTAAWIRLRNSWLGILVRQFRRYRLELLDWARDQHVVLPRVGELADSLSGFQSPAGLETNAPEDGDAPIFLLSTGWRAGSTLLQRILVTDPRLLLWGEPLGEMTLVSRMSEILANSISPRNLGLWRSQQDPSSPTLSTSWVANLYPPGEDFRLGLRSLLDRWLSKPARERGFARWGFKEVRLSATEACLLHWLYPNARFVIISRHPYDSFRSLADAAWGEVYFRYPDFPADSAANFARHWNRLALSWSELPVGFPSVHIKYEDLVAGRVDFRSLESWLGLELKEDAALSASVGKTARRSQLNWFERFIIAREAAEGMRALGYSKSAE